MTIIQYILGEFKQRDIDRMMSRTACYAELSQRGMFRGLTWYFDYTEGQHKDDCKYPSMIDEPIHSRGNLLDKVLSYVGGNIKKEPSRIHTRQYTLTIVGFMWVLNNLCDHEDYSEFMNPFWKEWSRSGAFRIIYELNMAEE